ncbi:MAG TPA: MFS transporter [Egibacteraceae bacterium]|nr:MFS transporter [Egibacteraceae bacterium]
MPVELQSPPPAPAVATLRPVSAAFALFGVFWGGWAVAAADIEEALGVTHGQFGALLSVALGSAAVANAVGGALVERYGTSKVLGWCLGIWGLLLVAAAALHQPWAFAAALTGTVAVGGMVDVAMNVAAAAGLAGSPGALVRFHARFNIGAAVGAALTGGLLASFVSWRWAWVGVGLVAVGLAVWCARSTLHASEVGERVPLMGALGLLRRDGLLLIAFAFAVGAVVEGGIELWGVLFLRSYLESGIFVGAGSAVAAYSVATLARVFLGPRIGRWGAGRGITLGAGVAVAGILLLGLAPTALLSGAGLVLAAGGISMCWPLLLAYATAGRPRPGQVIGGMSTIGYLGFVAGPAVIGWMAGAAGLRSGLLLLAALGLFVAAAPAISARQTRRSAAPAAPPPGA